MEDQVNPLEREHSLCVVLPGGLEKNATVHGSKPVMDLLVTLCASHHLNPSDYTVEVLSPNKNNISFKPNSPVGLLEAEKIILKPRGVEEKEKIRRPYMPEATVRLLINYNKSHKTVVRVNPRLPLEMLLPVVCEKCELQVATTSLLRDSESKEPLDLSKTLNDHGLREVFAKDSAAQDPADQPSLKTPEAAAVTPAEVISPPPLQDSPKKEKKLKENSGFFSLFRRRKKKHETKAAASAPASPGHIQLAGDAVNLEGVSSSNTLPADMPKKRRAPQPPMGASQSVPNNLDSCHSRAAQRSGESTLRSTKRRAPPPPSANTLQELQAETNVTGAADSLKPLEEQRESDESECANRSLSSSPRTSQPRSSSSSSRPSLAHLHEVTDPYLLPLFRGKDLSDARCALARVLTSSVSKGTLVKRLRNSATFPKFHNGSSFLSSTPKCSDNGALCADLESVLTSELPTESEWEDPAQRRGLTTFKVVPSKKLNVGDAEISLNAPDQTSADDHPESEGSPDVENSQTEAEDDLHSPDTSESEAPLASPELCSQDADLSRQEGPNTPLHEATEGQEDEEEPEVTSEVKPSDCSDGDSTSEAHINPEDQNDFIQSPSTDVEQSSSCGVEKKVEEEPEEEEEEEEEETAFPPPPPPVFFNEDMEVIEEEKEDPAASCLPPSPTSNGQTTAPSEESTSATPVDKTSAAPSRFAQAVAMAVQRSRLQSRGKSFGPQVSNGPHSSLPSPPRSTYQYGA